MIGFMVKKNTGMINPGAPSWGSSRFTVHTSNPFPAVDSVQLDISSHDIQNGTTVVGYISIPKVPRLFTSNKI